MVEPTKAEMDALDALLADVAGAPDPVPSDDLMARILADAEASRPVPAAPPEAPRLGWRNWLATLGGWPVLGGMAMAGVAGLWLGVAPPAAVDQMVAEMLGETVSVDLLGLTDPFELEG
ncbi:UPF0449 family protein [Flavimaricola marinus]|nr:UPF0449 family protein [Flavimaricola marinus]